MKIKRDTNRSPILGVKQRRHYTVPAAISSVIKEGCEQWYQHQFDNLNVMDQLTKKAYTHKCPIGNRSFG